MVQKIAKEMIQLARQEAAQDIYLIPKSSCYELYYRQSSAILSLSQA